MAERIVQRIEKKKSQLVQPPVMFALRIVLRQQRRFGCSNDLVAMATGGGQKFIAVQYIYIYINLVKENAPKEHVDNV